MRREEGAVSKQVTMSGDAIRRLGSAKRGNKYRAIPITVDGHRFPSKAEAARYIELHDQEEAGEIRDLQLHPYFLLLLDGTRIGRYTADSLYWQAGERVCEDVKGRATRDLKLRLALVKSIYGIDVRLVRMDYRHVNALIARAVYEGRVSE